MSAPATLEGNYRICFMAGCLTAQHTDKPLVMMERHEGHQIWEVKKHGSNEYQILCSHDKRLGATYPKDLDVDTPITLGQNPRLFKIVSGQEKDHYMVSPCESGGEKFNMAMSPSITFPPMVALASRDVEFMWRFERA